MITNAAVALPSENTETLYDILSTYVDRGTSDSCDVAFDAEAGTLAVSMTANYMGTCHVTKRAVTDVFDDLRTMAALANEFMERLACELAYPMGLVATTPRPPQDIPAGFELRYETMAGSN